jgi:hypothetical protein
MEFVKHHVDRSGNTSLRGFFSSDAVDFDPPSLSLRANITKAKAKVVYDLADGFTSDSEEDEIRDILIHSENSYELIRLVDVMEGWEGMDDELPEGHVDQVATQLAGVLDQRDYVVYQLIRRYLILLDYTTCPNLGDCFMRLLAWPKEFQAAEFDLLLSSKGPLLKGIASATMRERKNMVEAARIHINVISQYLVVVPHRVNDLMALMFEVNYTTRICALLVAFDYRPLYDVIADMVNPALSNLERQACRDTCDTLSFEFSATAKAVEFLGSNEAKSTINRFMRTLNTALVNFPTTLPAPTDVGAIVTALGGVGNTLVDLQTTIFNLPDAFGDILDISNILNTSDDDKARTLASELNSQGWLSQTSFNVKLKLVNSLLSGSTGDDDEIALLRIMEAAKVHELAELYQLAAAATWEALYSSVDGDEYDTLESILHQPI